MINPINLRPKNLVLNKGEVYEVSSVSQGFEPPVIVAGKKYPENENTNIVYLDPKEVSPIPVTEEWITKFNLEKMVVNGFFVEKSEYGGYGFFVITDIEAEPMEKLELCRISGVHHLQNLFAENAGFEIKQQ